MQPIFVVVILNRDFKRFCIQLFIKGFSVFSDNVLPQIGQVAKNLVAIDAIETATKMDVEAMEDSLKDRVEGSLTIKAFGFPCIKIFLLKNS